MPPKLIPRRVEDFIFYYYAKLVIAPSAGFAANYRFVVDAYKRLKNGQLSMSDYDRELTHLSANRNTCAFCGEQSPRLQPTAVVPKRLGGPIGIHNSVLACDECVRSKNDKDLVKWWCAELSRKRDDLPRVPLGLYLKIAYDHHKVNFTLKRACNNLEELFG